MKPLIYKYAQSEIKRKLKEIDYLAERFALHVLENNPSRLNLDDDNLFDDFEIWRLH
jgi:hypothetical protein